ncbi:MAG TPA: GNAT family N-acetyltransferase [Pyrinomonadaceae bacterium]|nr:GNAT family N-acetyltransferase [Pyrinomonadaceae bacterium]
MSIFETERLVLRRMTADDAEFICKLVNEPSFLRFIGDKGVRNEADAVRYIQNGPVANYQRFGFGQYVVELKNERVPIGMCGLTRKDALPAPDVGFAFLPEFWSKGYAFEAASAVMNYSRNVLGLRKLVAVTLPDNESSIKLLEKIGLKFERLICMSEDASELRLHTSDIDHEEKA